MNFKHKFQSFLQNYLFFAAVVLLILIVAQPMSFSGRLFGQGDISNWESLGDFFRRQIQFLPYPWIEFYSDRFLFPYGFTNVMQTWGFEREYLNLLLTGLLGDGPWLQSYFLLSLGLTACGFFLIFRKMLPVKHAAVFSLLPVLANAYLFFRYPGHLNIAVAHWALIGIAMDYSLCRSWFLKDNPNRLNALLFLLRLLLLVATLGLDLGYVAGYSFTSFFLTTAWIGYSAWKTRKTLNVPWRAVVFLKGKKERIQAFFISAAGVVLAFFYLPLILDVLLAARPFAMPQVSGYWVNPLHLFHPWIPGIDPISVAKDVTSFLRDRPEGPGDFNPGLALLLGGGFAVAYLARLGKLKPVVPFVFLFLICIAHHPSNFNLLNVFPWFKYHRVPSRSTLFFPLLLTLPLVEICCQNLHKDFFAARQKKKLFFSCALALLFVVETGTQFYWHAQSRSENISRQQSDYFKVIQNSRGAGLLNFPFCVTSGNGVATNTYCPSFEKLSALGGMSIWHGKKVLDIYAGRMHPNQIQALEDAGFATVMKHFFEPQGLQNCLSNDEWNFLDQFYTLNDFAGIQVIDDFVPEPCRSVLYKRFGNPSAHTLLPLTGPVSFVPKDAYRQGLTNPEKGKKVAFEPTAPPWLELDLLQSNLPSGTSVAGLEPFDFKGSTDLQSRVSRSVCLDMTVFVNTAFSGLLNYEFENRVPAQKTTLSVNNIVVAREEWKNRMDKRFVEQSIDLKKGANKLSLCHEKRLNFKVLMAYECSRDFWNCVRHVNNEYALAEQNKSWAGVYSRLKLTQTQSEIKPTIKGAIHDK